MITFASVQDGDVHHVERIRIADNIVDHGDKSNLSVVAQAPSETLGKAMEDMHRSLPIGDVQDDTESMGKDDINYELWDSTGLATNNVEVNEDNFSGHPVLEDSCWHPLSERPEDEGGGSGYERQGCLLVCFFNQNCK